MAVSAPVVFPSLWGLALLGRAIPYAGCSGGAGSVSMAGRVHGRGCEQWHNTTLCALAWAGTLAKRVFPSVFGISARAGPVDRHHSDGLYMLRSVRDMLDSGSGHRRRARRGVRMHGSHACRDTWAGSSVGAMLHREAGQTRGTLWWMGGRTRCALNPCIPTSHTHTHATRHHTHGINFQRENRVPESCGGSLHPRAILAVDYIGSFPSRRTAGDEVIHASLPCTNLPLATTIAEQK